ncbi:hypothetical protein ACQ4PT_038360 [Festuca glaucescens]
MSRSTSSATATALSASCSSAAPPTSSVAASSPPPAACATTAHRLPIPELRSALHRDPMAAVLPLGPAVKRFLWAFLLALPAINLLAGNGDARIDPLSCLVYVNGTNTMSTHERKAIIREFCSMKIQFLDTVGNVLPSEDSISERRRKLEFLEMQEELIKEEQRVIEAQIRVRHQELQDDADRLKNK